MASVKRWPIGLQSSVTGDPQGIGDVIRELTDNSIATFSASTDSFSILTDLQVAREANPNVPHAANFTPTGFVDGYHLNVPVYGQPASVELAVRHWNKVEQRAPINDPTRSPIRWSIPCIWISTWNEVRPYVGWSEQGRAHTEADQPVEGYAGNADLIGWQAVEIGKEAVKRGYRWAAFGFAGGNPEEGFWDEPGVLEYLRLCEKFPDQLGIALHEYSLDDSILNKPDMIGRFKRLHDACDRNGIRRPVIQIKEFGWQATHIPKDQDEVIAKLVEVARIYMEHPNIHGAALWTVQKWQDSKIHQQVRALIPRLREAALQHAQEIRELESPPRLGAPVVPPAPLAPVAQPTAPTPPTPPDNAGSARRPASEWTFSILTASPEDAKAKLEVTTTEFGIEVSRAQEDLLNWNQLKKDGVRFAFIRVGTGHVVQDLYYMRNLRGCLNNDIPFGNVFTLFEDVDMLQQARMLVHQADWRSTLPPVVDIQRPNLTAEQIRAFVTEFHRLLDSPPIMIHTTASLWNTVVPKTEGWPSAHPLWVDDFGASVPTLPHHWDRWLFFEPGVKKGLRGYASTAEEPAGLDYSHFNGPLEELALPEAPPARARAVAFNDYIPFDAPIGTAEERRTKQLWPGKWYDANPFKTDYTNPTTGKEAYHTGSDLNHLNDQGLPVYAAADGVVTFAGQKNVWAGLIVIRHSPTLYSRYGHVVDCQVEAGQAVVRGQHIANVGQDAGGGPFHLHFDISQSDVLEAKPEHWPGCDLAAVEKHYVNPKDYIERHRPPNTEPAPRRRLAMPTQFGTVIAPLGANFRKEPNTDAPIWFALKKGTEVGIYRLLDNGWYYGRVRDQDGFVSASLISDLPAPEPDTSQFQTGMNINPDAPNSNPFDSAVLKGMDWVRLVFKIDARLNPPERGNIDAAFAQYDAIIRAYQSEGVGALIILNQETRMGNPAIAGADWPGFVREFAKTAGRIADHYRDMADGVAYEIWNEGDLKNNPASVFLEPAQYAPLLKATAEAIRDAAPAAPIIFGGLASGPLNGVAYVKAVREKLGGRMPVDAIGIHPYGRWVTKPPFEGWGFGTLQDALEFYRANLPGQRLWITEIGIAEDSELGPEHYPAIARYVMDVFNETGRRFSDLVPVLIWFAWSDHMRNAGIVKRDGSVKEQVFDAFRQVRDRTLFS